MAAPALVAGALWVALLFATTPPGKPHEAWLIADARARRRYGIGWVKPLPFPDLPYERRGYLVKARRLAQLAARCGIDDDDGAKGGKPMISPAARRA